MFWYKYKPYLPFYVVSFLPNFSNDALNFHLRSISPAHWHHILFTCYYVSGVPNTCFTPLYHEYSTTIRVLPNYARISISRVTTNYYISNHCLQHCYFYVSRLHTFTCTTNVWWVKPENQQNVHEKEALH